MGTQFSLHKGSLDIGWIICLNAGQWGRESDLPAHLFFPLLFKSLILGDSF